MRFIFLVIGFSFSLVINAQTWFPKGASWTFERAEYGPLSFFTPVAYGYSVYTVGNDTIVDGINCKIIDLETTASNGYTAKYPPDLFAMEKEGRVYFRSWNTGKFILSYDFNLNQGDTLPRYNYHGCDSVILVIDSIDSVQIQGVTLARQHISNHELSQSNYPIKHHVVIERIGALNHSEHVDFRPINGCTGLLDPPSLGGPRCYTDAIIHWSVTDSTVCDTSYVIVGIDAIKTKENQTFLFPNPFSKQITNPEQLFVRIYNLTGELLITSNSKFIDTQSLIAGIYLAQVGEVPLVKLVKIK